MSYLYRISMEFYNKLLKYYEANPKEFFAIGKPSQYEHDISSDFYQIIHSQDNYFHMFYHFFVIEFFDVDFFADYIESGVYIGNPRCYHHNGNANVLKEYYEQENTNLLKAVRETLYTHRIINGFIKKMRRYYLEDFLKRRQSNSYIDILKRLYNKLSFSTKPFLKIKLHTTYEEIYKLVKEEKYAILDKCSELIDTDEFKKTVINQQEYYINEIERLELAIKEKGNITNLNDELFMMYIEFMQQFKQEAIMKKEKMMNELKSIKTLKLV